MFVSGWTEALTVAPKPGEPHPEFPALTVDTVEITPEGSVSGNLYTGARIVANYRLDYHRPEVGEPPRISYEFATETLNTTPGRVWETTNKSIDIDDLAGAVHYPMLVYTVEFSVEEGDLDIATILNRVGKINDDEFLEASAETMLFEGAQVNGVYNYDAEGWDYRVTYKFLWRPRSHNMLWRAPLRLWDDTAGTWVRNNDGTYQYAAGAAGVGDWDETDPPLYTTASFDDLLPDENP